MDDWIIKSKDEFSVILKAREFIKRVGIVSFPIKVEQYLDFVNADLKIKYDLSDDIAGITYTLPNKHVIVVNGSHIEERQRFTILHEIAHIELGLPSNHDDCLKTALLEKYNKRPKEEILCDLFAAECLLPYPLFRDSANSIDICIDSVIELAQNYKASITSTASRFAAVNNERIASILYEKNSIKYVSLSTPMREFGFYVPIGSKPPKDCAFEKLNKNNNENIYNEIPGYIWTDNPRFTNITFCEEASKLNQWQQAISLIWIDDDVNNVDQSRNSNIEVSNEDELLTELDGILPWPGRSRRK